VIIEAEIEVMNFAGRGKAMSQGRKMASESWKDFSCRGFSGVWPYLRLDVG
jgi:hypothetical protein